MGLFSRKPHFDAFISYRRDGSAELARLLKAELEKHKINAFIDVDNLNQSYFDEQLLVRIANTSNFILVLNDNSFDRCNDPNDWLRREIEQAIKTNRKIIPVFRQGFRFPNQTLLPGVLKDLPRYQSVGYIHEYHEASIQKLVNYLNEKQLPLKAPEIQNVINSPNTINHSSQSNKSPIQEQTIIEHSVPSNNIQIKVEPINNSTNPQKMGTVSIERQSVGSQSKIGKITIEKL